MSFVKKLLSRDRKLFLPSGFSLESHVLSGFHVDLLHMSTGKFDLVFRPGLLQRTVVTIPSKFNVKPQ